MILGTAFLHGIRRAGACPGEVGTGSPIRTCANPVCAVSAPAATRSARPYTGIWDAGAPGEVRPRR